MLDSFSALVLLFFCLSVLGSCLSAQHFLGGQTWMGRTGSVDPPGEVTVFLEVYRTVGSTARENILLNWGDGQTDTLDLHFSGWYPDQYIVADYYRGTHTYDTIGHMVYEYRDSFLVDHVLNIPNSGQQPLIISDTVLVFDLESAPYINPVSASVEGMIPATSLESFTLQPDGELTKTMDYWRIISSTLPPYTVAFQPYPLPSATIPAATDSIGMLDYRHFSWFRPPAAGRYALSFHTRQLSGTNNPYYDNLTDANGRILTNTLTRSVILDITEDMIVDVQEGVLAGQSLRLFPNPAHSICQLGGIQASEPVLLSITDTQGKLVYEQWYSEAVLGTPISFQVSNWPKGVYLVAVQSSEGRAVSKLIVH